MSTIALSSCRRQRSGSATDVKLFDLSAVFSTPSFHRWRHGW